MNPRRLHSETISSSETSSAGSVRSSALLASIHPEPNGHEFEVFQNMSEDPVTRCRECSAPVERVFQPIAVHFKGSGFYTTDYAKKKAPAGGNSDSGSGDSKGDSKSESKSESSGESKSSSGDS